MTIDNTNKNTKSNKSMTQTDQPEKKRQDISQTGDKTH